MLSGVAPFAIEQGLVKVERDTTRIRVHNVNTGARIDVTVRTPDGRITYDGDTRIDGVAGTGAPILLDFLDAWGAVTGQVFPTGKRIDVIDGIEVTCIDAAMPLMIVRLRPGVSGREAPATLDSDAALLARLETLRLQAGLLMGLGDVSDSVIPKPVLVSPGDSRDSITSRYFTPRAMPLMPLQERSAWPAPSHCRVPSRAKTKGTLADMPSWCFIPLGGSKSKSNWRAKVVPRK